MSKLRKVLQTTFVYVRRSKSGRSANVYIDGSVVTMSPSVMRDLAKKLNSAADRIDRGMHQ